ncbi:MAG: class I SAM-dependent methyltransferase [Candidatus Rokubacteria bacterium]|nr:class I SAM-dependent methyltransferase [Candidatus Rokubacteria bacterium]
MKEYGREFYANRDDGARRSAELVVPIVMELVRPRRVVDVGCGEGAWLAVFREHGAEVRGVDGDWVDRARLKIPADRFTVADLGAPLRLDERFDLAVSLEVAEHLDPSSAETFVESLARLAPVVLFSAAIPGQGGRHHVNEQWPAYWARLFEGRGLVPVDAIRSRIWGATQIEWWYAQNAVLFASPAALEAGPALRAAHAASPRVPPALVHPRHYAEKADPGRLTLSQLLRLVPAAIRRAAVHRWRPRR